MLDNVQLARRLAQPAEHQDQRHQRPGNVFAARRDRAIEKLLQTQPIGQCQPQPRTAEIATVLHSHPLDVDFDPLRPNVVEEPFLPQVLPAFGRLFDA